MFYFTCNHARSYWTAGIGAMWQVGDLTMKQELCKMAQQWAQHLTTVKKLQHSRNNFKGQPLGENLAYKFASNKEAYPGASQCCYDTSINGARSSVVFESAVRNNLP